MHKRYRSIKKPTDKGTLRPAYSINIRLIWSVFAEIWIPASSALNNRLWYQSINNKIKCLHKRYRSIKKPTDKGTLRPAYSINIRLIWSVFAEIWIPASSALNNRLWYQSINNKIKCLHKRYRSIKKPTDKGTLRPAYSINIRLIWSVFAEIWIPASSALNNRLWYQSINNKIKCLHKRYRSIKKPTDKGTLRPAYSINIRLIWSVFAEIWIPASSALNNRLWYQSINNKIKCLHKRYRSIKKPTDKGTLRPAYSINIRLIWSVFAEIWIPASSALNNRLWYQSINNKIKCLHKRYRSIKKPTDKGTLRPAYSINIRLIWSVFAEIWIPASSALNNRLWYQSINNKIKCLHKRYRSIKKPTDKGTLRPAYSINIRLIWSVFAEIWIPASSALNNRLWYQSINNKIKCLHKRYRSIKKPTDKGTLRPAYSINIRLIWSVFAEIWIPASSALNNRLWYQSINNKIKCLHKRYRSIKKPTDKGTLRPAYSINIRLIWSVFAEIWIPASSALNNRLWYQSINNKIECLHKRYRSIKKPTDKGTLRPAYSINIRLIWSVFAEIWIPASSALNNRLWYQSINNKIKCLHKRYRSIKKPTDKGTLRPAYSINIRLIWSVFAEIWIPASSALNNRLWYQSINNKIKCLHKRYRSIKKPTDKGTLRPAYSINIRLIWSVFAEIWIPASSALNNRLWYQSINNKIKCLHKRYRSIKKPTDKGTLRPAYSINIRLIWSVFAEIWIPASSALNNRLWYQSINNKIKCLHKRYRSIKKPTDKGTLRPAYSINIRLIWSVFAEIWIPASSALNNRLWYQSINNKIKCLHKRYRSIKKPTDKGTLRPAYSINIRLIWSVFAEIWIPASSALNNRLWYQSINNKIKCLHKRYRSIKKPTDKGTLRPAYSINIRLIWSVFAEIWIPASSALNNRLWYQSINNKIKCLHKRYRSIKKPTDKGTLRPAYSINIRLIWSVFAEIWIPASSALNNRLWYQSINNKIKCLHKRYRSIKKPTDKGTLRPAYSINIRLIWSVFAEIWIPASSALNNRLWYQSINNKMFA